MEKGTHEDMSASERNGVQEQRSVESDSSWILKVCTTCLLVALTSD